MTRFPPRWKFGLFLFAFVCISCSDALDPREDDPLNPAQYQNGPTILNLHEDGKAILCDGGATIMKSGNWTQDKFILSLGLRSQVKYDDKTRQDSIVTDIASNETWDIRKSEFGFHRLLKQPDGSFVEEVYLEKDIAKNSCRFE